MTRNLIHCEFFLLRYDEKKASNLVDCLMDIYTSHLLPTFNIVHSQYIIFYLANIDPGGVSNFHQKIFKLNASRLSPAVLNCYLENFFFSELSLNHKTGRLCWKDTTAISPLPCSDSDVVPCIFPVSLCSHHPSTGWSGFQSWIQRLVLV